MGPKSQKLDPPEWGNTDQIYNRFGLSRGTLYRLAKEGKIKSISIKSETARKGVRLFSYESIRDLLAKSLS